MSTKNYYEKYWENENNVDGHVNKIPNWPDSELELFYQNVKSYIGVKILDMGSGEGIFINFLRQKKENIKSIKGLEISEKAISKSKVRNPGVTFVQGSAENIMSFESGEFDTIFMTDVIEHLMDIDTCISECHRILKVGGKVIIITPDFNFLKKVIVATFFWERFFYPLNPHIRFFTKSSLTNLMQKHNFRLKFYRWGLTWLGIMPQNSYFVYEKIR